MRQMRSRKPAKRPTRVRLIMLCVGAAFFGIFFLTVLVRAVRGYSALKTGMGYLPLTAGIMVGSGAAAGLVPQVGARSVLLAGARLRLAARTGCRGLASTAATPARCWARCWSSPSASACCSCRSPSSPCPAWRTRSPGLRAGLRNTGQQVGGPIRLAVLGTVAWTVVAGSPGVCGRRS